MKAGSVLLPVVFALVAAPALGASAPTKHILTYLNSNHDVCGIGVDNAGKPVGNPTRMTSGGGYDSYSVSPNGKWIAGLKDIGGPRRTPGWEWKCFVERVGHGRLKQSFRIDSDGEPSLWWSDKGNYLFSWGGQVGGTTRAYDLRAGRKTLETDDCLLDMSDDERYAAILQDVGCSEEGPANLSVADLRTGRTRKLGRIEYETSYCVWLGKSHKCAFVDTGGNAWVASISSDDRGIHVSKYALTRHGRCSDLRATRSGLYFVQNVSGRKIAYYSSDLKTLHPGKLLGPKPSDTTPRQPGSTDEARLPDTAWRECAVTTPDGKLTACPIDAGECKMPLLMVFDQTGKSHVIGRGKSPKWKGVEYWTSSYGYLSNYTQSRWEASPSAPRRTP